MCYGSTWLSFSVWDHKQQKIMQYNADSHNQGGCGAVSYYCLDVYEHAYFIDFEQTAKPTSGILKTLIGNQQRI